MLLPISVSAVTSVPSTNLSFGYHPSNVYPSFSTVGSSIVYLCLIVIDSISVVVSVTKLIV